MIMINKKIFIYIVLCLVVSCKQTQYEPSEKTIEFYEKNKHDDFKDLFGLSVNARVFDEKGSQKLSLGGFSYHTKDGQVFNIPMTDIFTDDEELPYSKKEIEGFALYHQVNKDSAFCFIKQYCKSLSNRLDKLGILEVRSNLIGGEFIIFTITPNEYLVFLPDSTKIYKDIWRNFFVEAQKLDKEWFYSNKL